MGNIESLLAGVLLLSLSYRLIGPQFHGANHPLNSSDRRRYIEVV
jgi:hypothetical protein